MSVLRISRIGEAFINWVYAVALSWAAGTFVVAFLDSSFVSLRRSTTCWSCDGRAQQALMPYYVAMTTAGSVRDPTCVSHRASGGEAFLNNDEAGHTARASRCTGPTGLPDCAASCSTCAVQCSS